ncbi:MAG: IclR family transcriptional regulator [Rhizobiaceae bacterium]|nr:IclR family transcriptional regulator [Rhizobiaceae bacterium]
MARTPTNEGSIQAVTRTMKVIELLAETSNGMTVFEVADALGTEKSIASRLLSSLHMDGYVVRDPHSDRYLLSLKLLKLAHRHEQQTGFPGVCLPILAALRDETQELVQMAAVDGDRFTFVSSLESPHSLSIRPRRGGDVILHSTAAGKAWLATLSTENAIRLVLNQGLQSPVSRPATKLEDLLIELNLIRERGYAASIEETIPGVSAVGVAVGESRFGHAVGSVILAAPSTRLTPARFGEIAAILKKAATELSDVWPATLGLLAANLGRSDAVTAPALAAAGA